MLPGLDLASPTTTKRRPFHPNMVWISPPQVCIGSLPVKPSGSCPLSSLTQVPSPYLCTYVVFVYSVSVSIPLSQSLSPPSLSLLFFPNSPSTSHPPNPHSLFQQNHKPKQPALASGSGKIARFSVSGPSTPFVKSVSFFAFVNLFRGTVFGIFAFCLVHWYLLLGISADDTVSTRRYLLTPSGLYAFVYPFAFIFILFLA